MLLLLITFVEDMALCVTNTNDQCSKHTISLNLYVQVCCCLLRIIMFLLWCFVRMESVYIIMFTADVVAYLKQPIAFVYALKKQGKLFDPVVTLYYINLELKCKC